MALCHAVLALRQPTVTDPGAMPAPEIESKLGISCTNPALLRRALTHRSLTGGHVGARDDNQRLEWLGDRVLGLVVARALFDAHPTEDEGELARRFAALVSAEALSEVARALDLGRFLLLAPGEEAIGGRENPANLADACEALIGAVYLDRGMAAAQDFIERQWAPLFSGQVVPPTDPKTALQEWSQARGHGLPIYRHLGSEGPDHKPRFKVTVEIPGCGSANGEGSGKREAERIAAQRLLVTLERPDE